MPQWLAIVIVLVIAVAFGAAVAFGRKRQPCAVEPKVDDEGAAPGD